MPVPIPVWAVEMERCRPRLGRAALGVGAAAFPAPRDAWIECGNKSAKGGACSRGSLGTAPTLRFFILSSSIPSTLHPFILHHPSLQLFIPSSSIPSSLHHSKLPSLHLSNSSSSIPPAPSFILHPFIPSSSNPSTLHPSNSSSLHPPSLPSNLHPSNPPNLQSFNLQSFNPPSLWIQLN